MTEQTAIIEKIRKLLALADSSNEHEAALAASHVQRLLAEHNLELSDIAHHQQQRKADTTETSVAKTLPKWLRHLSAAVCSAFDCQAIHHPARGMLTFIGVGADVQVASYTFAYLDKTIRRLCTAYLKSHALGDLPARLRELKRQSYYLGAVAIIASRLREQKQQTPTTPGALIPVKEGLIAQAMQELGRIRTVHSRRSYVDSHAYSAGTHDGGQVGIIKGVHGTTAPPSAITMQPPPGKTGS